MPVLPCFGSIPVDIVDDDIRLPPSTDGDDNIHTDREGAEMNDKMKSPAQLGKLLSTEEKKNERHIRDVNRAREEGFRSGVQHSRSQVLGWLQAKYTKAPDRPDRDSKEAGYLLDLTRDLGKFLMELERKGR